MMRRPLWAGCLAAKDPLLTRIMDGMSAPSRRHWHGVKSWFMNQFVPEIKRYSGLKYDGILTVLDRHY